MEKKTIGKFISALRRANGMTQRELADKLFVSDKAVSRWERDECAPDLTLIPAIAEIFGITTDELLRGERNTSSNSNDEEIAVKQKNKSDKLFKSMLYNRMIKYKNLTLISLGLIALSLIAAIIFNLGLLKGIVGFCVASVFLVASLVCQVCFASSACMPIDDEDEHAETVRKANSDIVNKAMKVTFCACIMFAFILPISLVGDAYAGLTFGAWLKMGAIFAAVTLVILHVTYLFSIRKILIVKGLLHSDSSDEDAFRYRKKLLVKTLAISIGIALVLSVCIVVVGNLDATDFAKKHEFTDADGWKKFKEFMKNTNGYYDPDKDSYVSELPVYPPDSFVDVYYYTDYIYDINGDVYMKFEYRTRFYSTIRYVEFNGDGSPAVIEVYTSEAIHDARAKIEGIQQILIALIIADFAICAFIYISKYMTSAKRQIK